MKKIYLYVILTLLEITLAFTYGFILKNIFSTGICSAIALFIPFALILVFSRKNNDKIWKKLLKPFAAAVLFTILFIIVFTFANTLSGDLIGEYEVVVEHISGHGGGIASFISPHGTYESVDLNDYRIIFTNEDDFVDIGDTIIVREYKGLFDMPYYTFVKEIH